MSDELPENSLVLQALHAIRAEAKKTNERLERTNERLDALTTEVRTGLAKTNERLAHTNERLDSLERRQVESEPRLATELVAVVNAVNGLRDAIIEDRDLRSRVDKVERRLDAVEQKVKL